jgi:hypothetical protein
MADFLNDLIKRTLDIEDVFKDGYVDIAFTGSTSIKKVLPVIAPDLSYKEMDVANGTDWSCPVLVPVSFEQCLL